MAARDSGAPCISLLFLVLLNLSIGGLATEYVIETWATYLKEVPVDIAFWPCAIAGLFLGEFFIPAAIITWLVSLAGLFG